MKKLMKTVLGVWCKVLGTGAALAAELPFDPFVPFVPPAPQRSDLTKYSDGTEPIMFFLQQFMAGDSSFKFDGTRSVKTALAVLTDRARFCV